MTALIFARQSSRHGPWGGAKGDARSGVRSGTRICRGRLAMCTIRDRVVWVSPVARRPLRRRERS
jgi:hypothetical protein